VPTHAAAAPLPIPSGANHRSVLTGDWLYMQSFQMALEERNFRILDILIDLTQKMVEGELIQLAKIGRIDVTEEDALRLATYKTRLPVQRLRAPRCRTRGPRGKR